MASCKVVFAPEAEAQLVSLYLYVAVEASPQTAPRFTDDIVSRCESLSQFPARGAPRDDVRPGLRILPFRRVTIAYVATPETVMVLGIFYGGQDYPALIAEP